MTTEKPSQADTTGAPLSAARADGGMPATAADKDRLLAEAVEVLCAMRDLDEVIAVPVKPSAHQRRDGVGEPTVHGI